MTEADRTEAGQVAPLPAGRCLPTAQIDNGKSPDDPFNDRIMLRLPADTPYGNYSLKFMKLRARVDEANRRLIDSFHWWHATQTGGMIPPGAYERHVYANEETVYHMRRAADELIAMIWSLDQWKRSKGKWPSSIKVDSVGAALQPKYLGQLEVCGNHEAVLRDLNDIANAFKHSFVHTDLTILGRDEPCVHTLGFEYNKLESGVKFHIVSLARLVCRFSASYKDGIKRLGAFEDGPPPRPYPESAE